MILTLSGVVTLSCSVLSLGLLRAEQLAKQTEGVRGCSMIWNFRERRYRSALRVRNRLPRSVAEVHRDLLSALNGGTGRLKLYEANVRSSPTERSSPTTIGYINESDVRRPGSSEF